MRMRSTGLGKTELVGKITAMRRAGDYLALDVRIIEPTNWHIRIGLTLNDMVKIMSLILKPSNLAYLLIALFKNRSPQSHLEI